MKKFLIRTTNEINRGLLVTKETINDNTATVSLPRTKSIFEIFSYPIYPHRTEIGLSFLK